jgi:purine-binding chemotaxis protein CheW
MVSTNGIREADNDARNALLQMPDDDDDEDTQKDKYLTFHIAEEDYGIEISYVTEIVGLQHISEIPEMPAFIKGVINLRGVIIPVTDVRLRFGMEPRAYDERTCVVVVRMGETAVGLVVDTVKEVLSIPESSITEPPRVASAKGARYVKGIARMDNTVKIILNINALLHEEEREILTSIV